MTLRFGSMAEFEAWRDGRKDKPAAPPPAAKHKSGRMNKTEAAWALRLEARRRGGEIAGYRFESFKIRLADRTWYIPDFAVTHNDGNVEFQEIKGGFIREDSLVKWKVAREMYPEFAWSLWQRKRTQWIRIA